MYFGVMSGNMGWGVTEEDGWRKGPWTAEEDRLLIQYVRLHGEGRWNSVSRLTGLKRNGKSCRLRWVNYLRPDLKKGQITPQEESIILELHARWGNRWSTIARSLPGRTDNEIKNYWRTHFRKKTKKSSASAEKAKSRSSRKQQFQQQQIQIQQQQQQQLNFDMKGIINMLEENQNDHKVPSISQETQEMVNMFPTEQHCYFYNMLNGINVSSAQESSSEEILWDGLWNLDDIFCNFSAANATSKASLHNLVAPFC